MWPFHPYHGGSSVLLQPQKPKPQKREKQNRKPSSARGEGLLHRRRLKAPRPSLAVREGTQFFLSNDTPFDATNSMFLISGARENVRSMGQVNGYTQEGTYRSTGNEVPLRYMHWNEVPLRYMHWNEVPLRYRYVPSHP